MKENYTCLKGTVVDTVGGATFIEGARISMIPGLRDTSTALTNEEGFFWIESSEFDEDQPYIIRIEMENYFGNSWTNIRVDMDTINVLQNKVLDRKPTFDTKIDSIIIKEGGGDGPTDN